MIWVTICHNQIVRIGFWGHFDVLILSTWPRIYIYIHTYILSISGSQMFPGRWTPLPRRELCAAQRILRRGHPDPGIAHRNVPRVSEFLRIFRCSALSQINPTWKKFNRNMCKSKYKVSRMIAIIFLMRHWTNDFANGRQARICWRGRSPSFRGGRAQRSLRWQAVYKAIRGAVHDPQEFLKSGNSMEIHYC